MVIRLSSELEAALIESARRQGITPEDLALEILRARFLTVTPAVRPKDEWERHLISAATDCGVSLSDSALSSDGLYE